MSAQTDLSEVRPTDAADDDRGPARGPIALLAVVGPGEPGAVSCGPVGLVVAAAGAREAEDPTRRHQRVCAAALRGPVLPARRGASFPDLAAARAWAEARAPDLADALARLGDNAEFVIALQGAPADAPPLIETPAPGRNYLRRKARAMPEANRSAENARAALDRLWTLLSERPPVPIAGRRLLADPARGLADLCLLAPRDAGPALSKAVATHRPDAVLTGPWPPYSFAVPAP
ncbi:MAG: GvpL/GvpF family gas vesicle protein [Pseudomonadota bacterium]